MHILFVSLRVTENNYTPKYFSDFAKHGLKYSLFTGENSAQRTFNTDFMAAN
jgi:hypothetical protein